MTDTLVQAGVVLAGKYRVERVLGVGGMGMVVEAHHLQLDEPVAIKLLLPAMLSNADAVARFAREARAAIRIKSEHVVRIMDVTTLESGAPAMVMEYLKGKDLQVLIRERGRLELWEAADYLLQACEAIAEAHALGIVHRDLKPANLFLAQSSDGSTCVKVLDFGISKVTGVPGRGGFAMTSTQAVMGSPLYMSPEQMSSAKNVDARTDLWALGVILHEALTGKPPFEGESITQLVASVLTQAPSPARTRRPDLPQGVEPVILRCLEKNPQARWQNVLEFAQALLPFAPAQSRPCVERIARVTQASAASTQQSGQPLTARATAGGTLPLGTAPPPSSMPQLGAQSELRIPKQSMTPVWVFLGVLFALGGAVALFVIFFGKGKRDAVPEALASAPTTVAVPQPSQSVAEPILSASSAAPVASATAAASASVSSIVPPPGNSTTVKGGPKGASPGTTKTGKTGKSSRDLDMFKDNR